MAPQIVLSTLKGVGLLVEAREDRLWVEPLSLVTPDLRALIVEHRDALLQLLTATEPPLIVAHAHGAGDISAIDPAARIDRYHERVAIIAEGRDVTPHEALAIAEQGAGASLDDLAARAVARWRDNLEIMPPSQDGAVTRAIPWVRMIASQSWLVDGARFGWSDVDLFGVDPFAPIVRFERWGLAIGMALSPHDRRTLDGRMIRGSLISIAADHAITATPTGVRFRVERFALGREHAIPIWELSHNPTLH